MTPEETFKAQAVKVMEEVTAKTKIAEERIAELNQKIIMLRREAQALEAGKKALRYAQLRLLKVIEEKQLDQNIKTMVEGIYGPDHG